jgi:hypothetical protein
MYFYMKKVNKRTKKKKIYYGLSTHSVQGKTAMSQST